MTACILGFSSKEKWPCELLESDRKFQLNYRIQWELENGRELSSQTLKTDVGEDRGVPPPPPTEFEFRTALLSWGTFSQTIFYRMYKLGKKKKHSETLQEWCQVILTTSYHQETRIMNVLVTETRQRESWAAEGAGGRERGEGTKGLSRVRWFWPLKLPLPY